MGYCAGGLALATMPFTPQTDLWDMPSGYALQNKETFDWPEPVAYYDFILSLEERRPKGFNSFDRILLVACKAEECIDIVHSDPEYLTSIAQITV